MPARRRLRRRAVVAPRVARRQDAPPAGAPPLEPPPARSPALDPLGQAPLRRALRSPHHVLHLDAAPTEILEVVSGPYERPIALRGRP